MKRPTCRATNLALLAKLSGGTLGKTLACGHRLRVPRDRGQPFLAIVGGFGRQSEATVILVFERGSRDASGTTVDAPNTRRAALGVCAGDEREGDCRLAWAGEANRRGLSWTGAGSRSDSASSYHVRRRLRVITVPCRAVSAGRGSSRPRLVLRGPGTVASGRHAPCSGKSIAPPIPLAMPGSANITRSERGGCGRRCARRKWAERRSPSASQATRSM